MSPPCWTQGMLPEDGHILRRDAQAFPRSGRHCLWVAPTLDELLSVSNLSHCAKICAGWWSREPWGKQAYTLTCCWTHSCEVMAGWTGGLGLQLEPPTCMGNWHRASVLGAVPLLSHCIQNLSYFLLEHGGNPFWIMARTQFETIFLWFGLSV